MLHSSSHFSFKVTAHPSEAEFYFFFTQVSSWKVTCVQLFALAGNEGLHLRENQLNADQGVAVSLHFISMKISIEYRSRLQLRYTVELENHAYE